MVFCRIESKQGWSTLGKTTTTISSVCVLQKKVSYRDEGE